MAPAWHAAQAATPMDCCEGDAAAAHVEQIAAPADAEAACRCCPGTTDAEVTLADEVDLPTQETQPEPCPDDGNCPCCKSMVVVSVAVPLPSAALLSISDEPRDLLTAPLASPDSRGLATEPQPPKR